MSKNHNAPKKSQSPRIVTPFVVVIVLALLARLGILLFTPEAFSTDPDGYWALAVNVAQHGTLGHEDVPSAYRPCAYPILLAPCASLNGDWSRVAVGVLHLAMGMATVGLTFGLAVRVGLKSYAPLAALLVAFDPILLRQSTLVMTETAAAFFAAAGLYAISLLIERPTPGRAALVGGVLAMASLFRPVFLPWMVLSIVLLAVFLRRRSKVEARASRMHPASWSIVFTAVIAAACVLAPWLVRNQIQFGRPIAATTHGGYTLYLANNRPFYEYLLAAPWGSVWDAKELGPRWHRKPHQRTPEIELADDRDGYAAAFDTIRSRPGVFAYSCLVRVGRLWAVMPHQVSAGRLIAAWYVLEFSLAALGVWAICRYETARSPLWLWGFLLILCLTAVHTFYWTNMRMRAPLEPVIALAAAAGLAGITARKSTARRTPSGSPGPRI